MVTRSTVGSTREPAAQLNTSGAIPQEAATEGHFDSEEPSAPSHSAPSPSEPSHSTDPSFPSTSAGASWPVPLHVAAGENIAFPVPHPSAAATSSTPVASGRFRQRGQVHSYAPEFLHLNASFQNCLKVLSEQMAAGFNFINNSTLEMHTLLVTMRSEAKQSPNNTFFQSVLEQMETLSTSQQMQVMESCQSTLALIASRADSLSNHPPTGPPLPPLSTTTASTILLTRIIKLTVPHPAHLAIIHIVPHPNSHNTFSVPVPLPTSHTTSPVPLPTIHTTSLPLVPLPTHMMILTHTTSHLLHPRLLSLPTSNRLYHPLPKHLLHTSLILPPNPHKTFPTPLHPTKFLTPIPLSCPPAQ
ncbi:uncharacterized protein [Ranitomeya imitator]|uniref:uncharacterized protein n=1 Tax=Ranitomeya imitator TaxID=111125 RepID=UPI0037E85D23